MKDENPAPAEDPRRRISVNELLAEAEKNNEADERRQFCRDVVARAVALGEAGPLLPGDAETIWANARMAWEAKPEDL